MIDRIKQKIKDLSSAGPAFDPASLNDPVATNTNWGSLSRSSTNYKTHDFEEESQSRGEFKPTKFASIFPLIFLVVGLGLMIGFYYQSGLAAGEPFNSDAYFLLGIGALFAIVGGVMYYNMHSPIVFDKSNGFFWKGRKSPETVFNVSELKHAAKLEDIHAIQVLRKWVRGSGKNSRSYYCYEINLVLKDATRLNVVAHGNGHSMADDAQELGKFLGVPVWNATRVSV